MTAGGTSPAFGSPIGSLQAATSTSGPMGAPVLGPGQVYIIKNSQEFHAEWCAAVEERWLHAPRRLRVSPVSEVGAMTPCPTCSPPASPGSGDADAPTHSVNRVPDSQAEAPVDETLIPLEVVGLAHGILFLSASEEHRDLLQRTSVEPATPFINRGQREGVVVRVDASHSNPMVVVQLDPRAPFRVGPYHLALRRPLLRSATKPYAVESVEVRA